MKFFAADAFFKFMDHSRKGFTLVAKEIVDAFLINIKANAKSQKVNSDDKMYTYSTQELVDEFITNGATGVEIISNQF